MARLARIQQATRNNTRLGARQPIVYRPPRNGAGLSDMLRGLFGAAVTALIEERPLACMHLAELQPLRLGVAPRL